MKSWVYPGGEVGVTIVEPINDPDFKNGTIVQARVRSSDELMALILASKAIRGRKQLVLAYFPYARQDREQVTDAGLMPNSLRIVAELIDGLGYEKIHVLDPHSPALQAAFRNTQVVEIKPTHILPAWALNAPSVVIAPDAGAVKRAEAAAGGRTVIVAQKERDPATGKIKSYKVEGDFDRAVVIDDICDGGATFCILGEALRRKNPKVELELHVSHGIFSNSALTRLQNFYSRVVTTNSFHSTSTLESMVEGLNIRLDVLKVVDDSYFSIQPL